MNMKLALGIGAAVAFAGAAHAQTLTLNHGNATAQVNPMNASGTGSSSLRPDSDTNHVSQNWWWYRINGLNTRENPMPAVFTTFGNGTSSGGYIWTGLENGAFDADLSAVLTDRPAPGEAELHLRLTITNTSGGSLSMAFFHYLDFDINGATDNSAVWQDQASNIMRVNHNASGSFGMWQGVDADAFQVGAFSSIRDLLTNSSVDNLNNTGLPFAGGNWTGGFQWNVALGAGESIVLTSIMTINQVIPTPGAFAFLAAAGFVRSRRRRS